MAVYCLKRLGLALLVALTVSAICFSLVFTAGDPAVAIAGESGSAEDIEAIRKAYGFDRPIALQYWTWISKALQGDLGESFYFQSKVSTLIFSRLPRTMYLAFSAILFAFAISLPMGVVAAMRPNSLVDRAALFISVVGQALPSFWFSLILVVLFAVKFGVLPVSGSDTWLHFVMPTVALGYYATPAIMRLTRTGMLEALDSDYVRTARSKGLSVPRVLFKHALRNAILPVISLAAVQFGFMLGGSIVIETIFVLQGAGHLGWESITRSDFPTVQGLILVFSSIYITLTFLADIFNAWVDPRIRLH